MKKVIVLLIDSFIPRVLESCLHKGVVPSLEYLKNNGKYWSDCVTVFPTMTASVDSSLLTGVYPDTHRIPGLIWYNPMTQKIVNYLNGWKCVNKLGLLYSMNNVLYHLNEQHLNPNVTTLFEEFTVRGLRSASINAIVHRGLKRHAIKLPFLLRLLTGFRIKNSISGPEILTLGAMIDNDFRGNYLFRKLTGCRRLYGINDSYAVEVVKHLIQSGRLPDFTLVYLPDNDKAIHKKGPNDAESPLIEVDRKIQDILNTFPSWEEALEQCVFIAVSDHGQTQIGKEKSYSIDLDELLREYHILRMEDKAADHDVVIANNERMAYIYPLKSNKTAEIIEKLASDPRIDIIAWKHQEGVHVRAGGNKKNLFFFRKNGTWQDLYGVSWHIEGDNNLLDLHIEGETIHFVNYPDALSRLYGALYSQDIPMIVITPQIGYELRSKHYPSHLNGGSHGSLHQHDSLIPLIIAGTDKPFTEHPRLVDLKDYILSLFHHEDLYPSH